MENGKFVVTWNSVLLIKPLVNGKRIKEYFQIVYGYSTKKWVFNYAKGMAGAATFTGYRLNGDQFVGDNFAELLTLNQFSMAVGEAVIDQPAPDPEPDTPTIPVDPTPTIPPVSKEWQTTYEWTDVNYSYRLQRMKR